MAATSAGTRSDRSPWTVRSRSPSSATSRSPYDRVHARCSGGSCSGRAVAPASGDRMPASITYRVLGGVERLAHRLVEPTHHLELGRAQRDGADDLVLAGPAGGEVRRRAKRVRRAVPGVPRGGTVTNRIRSAGTAADQVSTTRRRSWRQWKETPSLGGAPSCPRTDATKSAHVVVPPLTIVCCQADTSVRAMSRAPITTCTRWPASARTSRRAWRGRARDSSSSETTTVGPSWESTRSTSRPSAPAASPRCSPPTRWPSRS